MENLFYIGLVLFAGAAILALTLMYLQYKRDKETKNVTVQNMPTVPTPPNVIQVAPTVVPRFGGDTDATTKGNRAHLEQLATDYYNKYMSGSHQGRVSFSHKASLAVVINILRQKFHQVTVIDRNNDDEEQGSVFLECTNVANSYEYKAFVGLWWSLRSCEDYEPISDWNMKKHASNRGKGEDFQMVHTSTIIFPDPTRQSSIKEESFRLAIEEARVKKVSKKIEESRFYELVKTGWGINLEPKKIPEDWYLRKEELQTNYPNIYMGYKARFDRYSIEKVMFLAIQFLLNKKSIGLNGVFGPGKSKLMFHLAYLLGQEGNIKIINTTESTLMSLFESNTDLSKIFKPGFHHIMLIDEIDDILEDHESLFKNLCDGTLSKLYNLSILFTFNKQIDDYEKSMYRPGRVLLIEPKRMSKEEALVVAKRLASQDEKDLTNKVFDMELYLIRVHNDPTVQDVSLATIYDFLDDADVVEAEKKVSELFESAEKHPVVATTPLAVPAPVSEPNLNVRLKSRQKTRS